jgi:hypothetical protein
VQGKDWLSSCITLASHVQHLSSAADICCLLLLCCWLPQLERPLEDTIRFARERNLPLIIDGSGLNFIANRLQLVQGYSNCILTPNIAEFGRLAKAAGVQLEGPMSTAWQKHVSVELWRMGVSGGLS